MSEAEMIKLESLSQLDPNTMFVDSHIWSFEERLLLAIINVRNAVFSSVGSSATFEAVVYGLANSIISMANNEGWENESVKRLGGKVVLEGEVLLMTRMAARLKRNSTGQLGIAMYAQGMDQLTKGAALQATALDRDVTGNGERNVKHFMFLSYALVGVARELTKDGLVE